MISEFRVRLVSMFNIGRVYFRVTENWEVLASQKYSDNFEF